MKLKELLKNIITAKVPAEFENIEITEICSDSRRVAQGNLFVALQGPVGNGEEFIGSAIKQGAVVIVLSGKEVAFQKEGQACQIFVKDPAVFLKDVLKIFYQNVSQKIRAVGITGTNGKTTITYLLESILESAGKSCGVIGTVNCRFNGKVFPAKNTTPGMIDNHRYLHAMSNEKCLYCAMEVSSHALEQGRVAGIDFRAGIFTNLTSDHLDYHHNREEYFLAKSRLFAGLSVNALALINQDDAFADRLQKMSKGKVMTYGIKTRSDFSARDIQLSFAGTRFALVTPDGQIEIQTPLLGIHNVYNILAAVGFCHFEALTLEQIKKGIESLSNVPGRLERIDAGQDFTVLVDYAHTEDALKNVLTSLRQVSTAKIVLVFGCGGDRDKTKRPLMGKVAGAMADFSIITNDNPRREDPQDIADQIVPGYQNKNFKIVLDRREAIKEALGLARAKDIVLIAGKGHEDYQVFKDRTMTFDERQIVRECLQERLQK